MRTSFAKILLLATLNVNRGFRDQLQRKEALAFASRPKIGFVFPDGYDESENLTRSLFDPGVRSIISSAGS
jgi:hypothetical protein